jgi:1-acyl-sn-glycerol-3-phosphate acyltransferase
VKVVILGPNGLLARETREELGRLGHQCSAIEGECAIYLGKSPDELRNIVRGGGFRRLVVRSHAYAYGASCKNAGFMTEERVSLLPAGALDRFWLRLEEAASESPTWAAIRFAAIPDANEEDPLIRCLIRRGSVLPAGRDPNVQFISPADAAQMLARAVESDATGVFNAAGDGAIPLRKALRAAGATRVPVPGSLLRLFRPHGEIEKFEHNWTVSSERAKRELGFTPQSSSREALAEFLQGRPRTKPELLAECFDDWGMDAGYIRSMSWLLDFLRKIYWRIEYEGMENIPRHGRAFFVSNHRGFIPIDAVMHLGAVWEATGRLMRFLIIPGLLHPPFHSNFFTKLGGVIASQRNAARLFERENLVGIFPEGIRGAFTEYKNAYKLRDFSTSAFVRMAIENQAPMIPAVTVGHAEIYPIIGRINWRYLTRKLDWPFLPIAPPFPLLPLPNPSKWHVRILRPIPVSSIKPAEASNKKLVRELSRYVQHVMQQNIDDMVRRRRNVFFGKILDGTGPVSPPFTVAGALHQS